MRMQQLAKCGAIPRFLAKMKPPLCVSCIHGKATKKPWHTKSSPSQTPKIATIPGECISVDQMESSTAGFIGQLKGSVLTMLRYKYTAVFLDLYSNYTYVQDIVFKSHYKQQGQMLTLCSINMITKNLWPYAMHYANNVNNNIPAKGSVQSPLELFSSMTMKLPICQFYHFGCPMNVLDSILQAKKRGGSKWRQ